MKKNNVLKCLKRVKTFKYTNHHKQMRVPFVIYAAFEALNQPAYKDISDSTRQIYIKFHVAIVMS